MTSVFLLQGRRLLYLHQVPWTCVGALQCVPEASLSNGQKAECEDSRELHLYVWREEFECRCFGVRVVQVRERSR